jgi:anti-sigma regulatory factor (Ser/Thr protein kinase)
MGSTEAGHGEHRAGIDLPPEADSVRTARSFVASVLELWECDDPQLVVSLLTSEIVTNAVRHAAGTIRLDVAIVEDDLVLVETTDDHPSDPVLLPVDPARPGGRGILLVQSLARTWGIRRENRQKVVWFEAQITHRSPAISP